MKIRLKSRGHMLQVWKTLCSVIHDAWMSHERQRCIVCDLELPVPCNTPSLVTTHPPPVPSKSNGLNGCHALEFRSQNLRICHAMALRDGLTNRQLFPAGVAKTRFFLMAFPENRKALSSAAMLTCTRSHCSLNGVRPSAVLQTRM
jgi:hypothetical protein